MEEKSNVKNEERTPVNILEQNSCLKIASTKSEEKPEVSNIKISETSSNLSDNKFDLPSFKCTECSYQSIWKHAVKRHQRTHFKDTEESCKRNKLECNHCSYTLDNCEDNWDEFRDHQTLHIQSVGTDNAPKDSKCELIQNNLSKNQQHKIRSSYKCKICQCKFKYRKSFENHNKIHKSRHESEVFKCVQCDFYTNKKKLFLKHARVLHEKDLSSIDMQIEDHGLTCEEMTRKINSISQVVSPKRTYKRGKYANVPVKTTKNGLFECEHCSYQTAIRTALVKHQTNHLKNT